MARFMLHSAVTLMSVNPTGVLGPDGRMLPKDRELGQFAADFQRSPVPIHHFLKAFDEMRTACLEKAREAGLITEK